MGILAFDIGGTQARCCVAAATVRGGGSASRSGEWPAESEVVSFLRKPDENGRAWFERILKIGRTAAGTRKIKVVTISFGGPVSPDGKVLSMHVPGWEEIDLRGEMERVFGVPVCIENDANSGAWGEFRYGAGRGCRYMAFFTVSTGIGGGVVLDGELYTGARGMAAEFGHMTLVDPLGAPQYAAGKPGVLEALASGPAIAREGKAALEKEGKSVPENFTAKNVFDAAANGETWAIGVRDVALGHLARGVAAVACLYDIERVVIGGGVSLAGDALFVPLREKVEKVLPPFLEKKVQVVPAALGDQAQLQGAIAFALEYLAEAGMNSCS